MTIRRTYIMKSWNKITLNFILCSFLFFFLFLLPETIKAAGLGDAVPINVNQIYTDKLENSSDVNYYKVDLLSPGKLSVNFKHDMVDYGSWEVYILNGSNQELTSLYSSSIEVDNTSLSIRVPAGTYYIMVDGYYFSNADYKLTVFRDNGQKPAVKSADPAKSMRNVPTNKTIAITFNELIVSDSSYSGITVKKGKTTVTITKTISGNVLYLDPKANLAVGSTYTVTIPVGAVKDLSGNSLAAAYSFSFKTAAKN